MAKAEPGASVMRARVAGRIVIAIVVRLRLQKALRLEIIVVIQIIGSQGAHVIDAHLMGEVVPSAQFAKELLGVAALRISQDARILGEGDQSRIRLTLDGDHWAPPAQAGY